MLRLLVPFAAGIVLAEHGALPLWFLAGAFALCGVVALLLRSSAAATMLLAVTGFGAAQLRERPRTVPLGVPCMWEVAVDGIPAVRDRFATADATVVAWRTEESPHWHASDDRIRLRTDSLTPLAGGERIRCYGTLRPLSGAEGFRRLMARRGFAGQLWLSERRVLERLPGERGGWHRAASERLRRAGFDDEAGAVVRAMTVADRSGIGPELRAAYSRSGMSHLLAVSGLHTGIVFGLANLLLRWLALLRRGHLLRHAAVVAAVWLYVAVTGFPPSAVRAAVMCTFMQAALASGSEYAGMNALAAAAFGMLLWNPAWIGDIGFQLSFVAVAAILAWGLPLCRRLRTGRRLPDAAIGTLCIGLTASAATAPLVSHAFGIVPLAGLLLNPVVIPLAALVVSGGVAVLAVPAVAPWAGRVAEWAAGALDALARTTASAGWSAIEWRLSEGAAALCYLVFVALTAAAWCREPKKNVHLPS